MSNDLALVTATEALRWTLGEVVGVVQNATVTNLRPDEAGTKPYVNVYLYQVAPNAALRNGDLPSRDSGGGVTQRPRAALDLYYLLSMHAEDKTLDTQRLLGVVVRTLHANPVLSATAIAQAVVKVPGSDLDKAPERIRFTPVVLSIDEISKLWSVFQTRYALSVVYMASVVFVEGTDEPSTPLPVRTRNVSVIPSFGPVIERVTSAPAVDARGDDQAITGGRFLHVLGTNLRGPNTRLRLDGTFRTPDDVTGDRITIELKDPLLTALGAGVKTVQVVHDIDFGTSSGDHTLESNLAAFVLAPAIAATVAAGDVQVTVTPPVRIGQKLVLLLNGPAAFRFSRAATAAGAVQTFDVGTIAAGTYLVRLQVDGAESPLEADANGRFTGPKVTL